MLFRSILEDEKILVSYKTSRDHGVFTDKKIILFDNYSKFGVRKQIYSIPYSSISTISVTFESTTAEIYLYLNSGYPMKLKFVNVVAADKVRLRVLYTCINRIINNQKPGDKDLKRLLNNDF